MEQFLQGCAERLDHRDSAAGEGDRQMEVDHMDSCSLNGKGE